MLKNKKAALLYYSLMFALVIALSILYAWDLHRNSAKNTDFVGQVFLDSYKETQNVFNDIYYIKKSVKYPIYNAIYPLAKKGFYPKDPCSTNEMGYVMWKNIMPTLPALENKDVSCYPTEEDMKMNYALFLNEELNKYFEPYTSTLIPKNNYDFIFNEKEKSLEIKGIATQKIKAPPNPFQYKQKVIKTLPEKEQDCLSKEGHVSVFAGGDFFGCTKCPEKAECKAYVKEVYCNMDPCNLGCKWEKGCKKAFSVYAIDPSFNIEMSYNFINKFKTYINKTKAIEKNITHCLEKGSYKPHDVDIITCSSIDYIKQQIKDIDDFEIIPIITEESILSKLDYTLLFNIQDESFKNPYSNEKLVIKFGLRFLDEFPPPATEIMTDINNRPLKRGGVWYLIWKTNNASDVVAYKIYYKKIEKAIDGTEIPSSPPTDISKMDNKEPITRPAPITEWPIVGLEGDYYFFIIAVDDANEVAKDIITKKVTIPSIEEAQTEQVLDLSQ